MASAKYTPAPTQDPDEAQAPGSSFTQAPPAYQTEATAAADEERLFGAPRDSEDNIPDDFKVRRRESRPSLTSCCRSRHSPAQRPVVWNDRDQG